MKKILVSGLMASLFFVSCKKDEKPVIEGNGSIVLEFDNIAGTSDLALNTANYTNASGQTYTISKFDYYISNIKLKKTDGTEYTVPQNKSYFLVKESDATTHEITLSDIPAGDYNSVSFVLGVDSLRSVADISQRTGVLDPAAGGSGMYWTWNSGYIFLKMEGTSPASGMPGNEIMYHIGGFGGRTSATINNIKNITLNFGATSATIRTSIKPQVHLLVDAKKVLDGATNISISANPMIMFDPASVNVANNYKNMFTVDHVHND